MKKEYLEKIALTRNARGVWDLDPLKGCKEGIENNPRGCYGICYAANIAKFRGYDFGKVVKRVFVSEEHENEIYSQIKKIPFVRLGVSCDPSSNWYHTLNIAEKIRKYQKNIVVVTKHWNELSEIQLKRLNGITLNTSVSALDTYDNIKKRVFWYNRLKVYCNSVLRVNTAKFNTNNENGKMYNKIQNELLRNDKVIDNVLRFPKSHKLVKDETIIVNKEKFLDDNVNVSRNDSNSFLGYCESCPDKCGINL
jgi:hypothetical protein